MVLVDRLVLAIDNLFSHGEWIARTKRLRKRHEFVDDAAEGPDVCLLCVWLRLDDLGARVQDSANERFHHASRLCSPAFG